jgi:hypothetical protein
VPTLHPLLTNAAVCDSCYSTNFAGITESMLKQPDVPTFQSAWQQLVDFIQQQTPVVRLSMAETDIRK